MSDKTTCGPTHYAGCACHEARRDAELAALRGLADAVRDMAKVADEFPWWETRREWAPVLDALREVDR